MTFYFDHNATSPATAEHLQKVVTLLSASQGNPSSPHTMGRNASVAVTQARKKVALAIGFDVAEIVFLSGGSEANNLGTVGVMRSAGVPLSFQHAIASPVEHPSIREPLEMAVSSEGLKVTTLNVTSSGSVFVDELIKSILPSTTLVTIMAANNETGSIQPVQEFAKWLHAKRWEKPARTDVTPHPFDF